MNTSHATSTPSVLCSIAFCCVMAAITILPSSASAHQCYETSYLQSLEEAAAVFEGHLTSIKIQPETERSPLYYDLEFMVDRGWKRMEKGDRVMLLLQRFSDDTDMAWMDILKSQKPVIIAAPLSSPDWMYRGYERVRQLYLSPCDQVFYEATPENLDRLKSYVFKKTDSPDQKDLPQNFSHVH